MDYRSHGSCPPSSILWWWGIYRITQSCKDCPWVLVLISYCSVCVGMLEGTKLCFHYHRHLPRILIFLTGYFKRKQWRARIIFSCTQSIKRKNDCIKKRLLSTQGLGLFSLLTSDIATARNVTGPGPGKTVQTPLCYKHPDMWRPRQAQKKGKVPLVKRKGKILGCKTMIQYFSCQGGGPAMGLCCQGD